MDRDTLFSPLLRYLDKKVRNATKRANVLDAYMYMSHDEVGYAYKHHATRRYILISEDGKLLDGKIDTTAW